MTRRVIFHSSAEVELNEAAAYYHSESPALAQAFLDDIAPALGMISSYPEAAPLLLEGVHRKLLRRFPYNILYSLSAGGIRILAIANQKRRPFYWRGRV